MKRVKKIVSLLSLLLMVVMLTGCLSIDMKVGKNGSLDMTYTIDTSQTQGMMSFKDIEKAIEDSVEGMNDTAGKKIAKLKGVKENKGKKPVTATVNVTDINKMGDGSFFGTVKEYRKENGRGLDNLVNTKDKSVKEDKVSDKLQMVYFPMGGTEQYGLIEVTVTVPGNIQYITDGGEIDKKNIVVFSGQDPLVVFKKGGGFPFWLLIIAAIAVVFFMMTRKKSSAPVSAAPAAEAPVQPPVQSDAPQSAPVQPPLQTPPAESQTAAPDDSGNNAAE